MKKQLRSALISGIWVVAIGQVAALTSVSLAQYDDKFDVTGGHFNKDEVNKDFFTHPPTAPAVEPAPAAAPAKPSDSWEVDESSFTKGIASEKLKDAAKEAQRTAPEPAAPFSPEPSSQDVPADLTRAAQAIEQLKTMKIGRENV